MSGLSSFQADTRHETRDTRRAIARVSCLVSRVCLLFLAAPAAAQDDPRFTRTEALVPMRDGVKLFTRVYVPKEAKGPLPILFLRTPYGIDGRAERQFRVYLRDLVED